MTSTETTENEDSSDSRRRWAETLFYVFVLGWFVLLVLEAREWGHQDRLLPMVALIAGIVLTTLHLLYLHVPFVESVLPESDSTMGVSPEEVGEEKNTTADETETERNGVSYLYILLWVLLLPIALYLIGFYLTIPLYVFTFVYFYRRQVIQSIIVSAFTTAFVYGLFEYVLTVRTWDGILF